MLNKLPELLDDIVDLFVGTVCESSAKKLARAEKKADFAHSWSMKLSTLLENAVWREICETYSSTIPRGDQISLLACITESVYDFAHIYKHEASSNVPAATDDFFVEDDIILHRFGGAAIYRMEKVLRNTINGKKGTVKVTDTHRRNLDKELEIVLKMKCEDLSTLPRELSVHLNEGGLHFMKDECLDFVRKADNCAR